MSDTLKTLLAKAQKAIPVRNPNAKHLHLIPIVETLERRGFNTYAAVRWLAEQGQIAETQIQTVYRSIRQEVRSNENPQF